MRDVRNMLVERDLAILRSFKTTKWLNYQSSDIKLEDPRGIEAIPGFVLLRGGEVSNGSSSQRTIFEN